MFLKWLEAFSENAATWIGYFMTVCGFLYMAYKKVKVTIMLRIAKKREFQEKLDTLVASVEKIHEQFRPNGGGSIFDKLNRIEKRLVVNEGRSLAMINERNIAYFESDSTGKCVWASLPYLDLIDRSLDDVVGLGWISTIHEEDREKVVKEWKEAIEQRREFSLSYRMVNRQGDAIKVSCHGTIVRDSTGEAVAYTGTLTIME